jgi:hypothetical protein
MGASPLSRIQSVFSLCTTNKMKGYWYTTMGKGLKWEENPKKGETARSRQKERYRKRRKINKSVTRSISKQKFKIS